MINEEVLGRKAVVLVYEINGHRDSLRSPRDTPLSAKVVTNFAEKWQPLGWSQS
jgi:hypothetical protein